MAAAAQMPVAEEEHKCRYCWQEANEGRELLTPCNCRGSMKYMCRECLWRRRVDRDSCEFCGELLNGPPDNRLKVVEEMWDENSCVAFHPRTMEALQLCIEDYVLLQAWGGLHQTVGVVVSSDGCDEGEVAMNPVMRKNLRVHPGATVEVSKLPDIPYSKQIHIVPLADTIKGFEGSIFNEFLGPYFSVTHRPLTVGDTFTVEGSGRTVEFLVHELHPGPYTIVAPGTVVYCGGVAERSVGVAHRHCYKVIDPSADLVWRRLACWAISWGVAYLLVHLGCKNSERRGAGRKRAPCGGDEKKAWSP